MAFVEPRTAAELKSHYAAVAARVNAPPPRLIPRIPTRAELDGRAAAAAAAAAAEAEAAAALRRPTAQRVLEERAAMARRALDRAREREAAIGLRDFSLAKGREIIKQIAAAYGMTDNAIRSRTRCYEVVHARQEAMYWVKRETALSYPAIARLFGKMDHTTVLHACRAHAKRLAATATVDAAAKEGR